MERADTQEQRAAGRVGAELRNKYRLDKLLGVGGMAAVYAATHRNGKRVAIKVLHSEFAAEESIKKRFLREGYAANRVDHPGAVSVLDDDTADDGLVFLVMELLEGQTLQARWERKGRILEPREMLWIADRVLDVLAAAHEKGILHRDLKPENLFLTREGIVKVLDFGIARLRDGQALGSTHATQVGTAMGSPRYMPPEQARGQWGEVDARTDLWALGATMFTCLSGHYVHEAETYADQLVAATTLPAPSLLSMVPQLPRPIYAVVDRALAFDREERWADARSMQVAVRDAYRRLGADDDDDEREAEAQADEANEADLLETVRSDGPPAFASALPQPQSKGVLWVVGGLTILALIGGGAWWMMKQRKAQVEVSEPAAVFDGGTTSGAFKIDRLDGGAATVEKLDDKMRVDEAIDFMKRVSAGDSERGARGEKGKRDRTDKPIKPEKTEKTEKTEKHTDPAGSGKGATPSPSGKSPTPAATGKSAAPSGGGKPKDNADDFLEDRR